MASPPRRLLTLVLVLLMAGSMALPSSASSDADDEAALEDEEQGDQADRDASDGDTTDEEAPDEDAPDEEAAGEDADGDGDATDEDSEEQTSTQESDGETPVVPLNETNPVSLNSKTVQPETSELEPFRPGDEVIYTINYDCSALATGGNCNEATLQDVLPAIEDVDGDLVQLELVSVNALTPTHWDYLGLSGANPDQVLNWDANVLPAGASGALIITLRIPEGVVPHLEVPQQFANTAEAGYPDQESVSVTSNTSYVNALPPNSLLTKTGPSTALLNTAGTAPISHDIRICPAAGSVLWDDYEVIDTLPAGASIVTDPLPFGGVFTPPDAADEHGGTIAWNLGAGNRPDPDGQGCLVIPFQVEYVNAISGGHESNIVGEQKTNTVEATGSAGESSQDIGPATTTLTLTGPQTRFGPSKSAYDETDSRSTYYVHDGETVVYRLGASNTSDSEAVPFTTATLTDGPLPDEFVLTEIRTGSWGGAVEDVSAVIEVSTDSTDGEDGSWSVVSTEPGDTVTGAVLDDVRWVRWVFTSTDDPAIGPGWNTTGLRLVGELDGDPSSEPLELTNCARLTGLQGDQTQDRGSNCAELLLETPQPHPQLSKSSPPTLEPGETITYSLTVGNNIDATGPLSNLRLTDCVPDAAHLTVHDIDAGPDWVVVEDDGTCTPAGGPPNNGSTGTQLVFEYVGDPLLPGEAAPTITYDVTANSYTVPVEPSEPTPPGVRRNVARVTEADGTEFNHCVQTDCQVTSDTTVPFRAELESSKLVRGTTDSHFNVAGTTTPGGQVTWRVQVENRGNVAVEDVQLIDIFPHPGDTGVRLLDLERGSEYAPRLVGPIDSPGWTVEYSRSDNPCRDEVLSPGNTPHEDCDAPEWTTTPDLLDLPSYRSIRLTLDGQLAIGELAVFEWDMVTPVSDPSYAEGGDPGGRLDDCTIPLSTPPYPANPGASELDREQSGDPTCPVANNSFAYGVSIPESELGGLPNPGRLGAEPPQVALHVASQSTGHVLGDRVWYDTNNDGIQDPDEDGVPGVRVELYDASDPDNPVWLATTFTDDDGIYLFDDLPDGEYVVRFYLPDDIAYVSPQNQDGVSGDQGPDDNSNRDSDVPQDPSGSNDLGNYYDTVVVTLGDHLGDDGREVDLTWDAGIWVPDPDVSIVKVTKDTDWPDSAADDGVMILEDRPVTWIYTVQNTGNTYLTDVTVTDVVTAPADGVDPPDDIVCDWGSSTDPATPAEVLSPGETVECRATGVAIAGEYANDATVTGVPAQYPEEDGDEVVYEPIDKVDVPTLVTDDDPSDYFGVEPDVSLDKTTEGRLYNLSTGQVEDVGPGDGIEVTAGLPVEWVFEITNTGTVALGDVTLVDDAGTPDDPSDDVTVIVSSDPSTPGQLTVTGIAADQVTLEGDAGDDGILSVGETWTIRIAGEAVSGAYANGAEVRGIAVDEEDGTPLTDPEDPRGQADDEDDSSYEGVDGPAIRLEKATNGYDADQPRGPFVLADEEITWTFEVTNTGSMPLLDVVVTDPLLGGEICTIPLLVPGATDTCEATGDRLGSGVQRNDAEVAGTPAETSAPPEDPDDPDSWSDDPEDYTPLSDLDPVTDDDPSHHYGADPGISLLKTTNGEDAATPGDAVAVGRDQPVLWEFLVTNTGNTTLVDIVVTDLVTAGDGAEDATPLVIECPTDHLEAGASMTCVLEGTVGSSDHANLATVEGQPVDDDDEPVGELVEDDDPSHYRIGVAHLSLDKSALDALVHGEELRWSLVVDNEGPDDAPAGTQVIDLLPEDTSYVGASPGWTCTSTTVDGRDEVTCVYGEGIAAGERVELVLTTSVDADIDEAINEAMVLGIFDSAGDGTATGVASAATETTPDPADTPDPEGEPASRLPRTGVAVLLLLALGMVAVATGTGLTRRRRP